MGLLLKLTGISIAGIGVLCGTVLITIYSEEEPEWRSLSEDSEFLSNFDSYSSGYGRKYARYFLGSRTSSASNINNYYWWKQKYKIFTREKPTSGKFKNVDRAYGNENTSLSEVCNDAYKATIDTYENQFKEEEVWKFCSFGGTKIKTIKEAYTNNPYWDNEIQQKYGKEYEEYFVAIDGNDWFWRIRHKDLISLSTNPASNNSKFRVENYKEMTLEHIKNKCKEAYYRREEESDYPKLDVFRFCSLSGNNYVRY